MGFPKSTRCSTPSAEKNPLRPRSPHHRFAQTSPTHKRFLFDSRPHPGPPSLPPPPPPAPALDPAPPPLIAVTPPANPINPINSSTPLLPQPHPPKTRSPASEFPQRPGFYLAATYSHKTCRLTTIGAAAFHFRVRNGTGWFHCALATRGQPQLSHDPHSRKAMPTWNCFSSCLICLQTFHSSRDFFQSLSDIPMELYFVSSHQSALNLRFLGKAIPL